MGFSIFASLTSDKDALRQLLFTAGAFGLIGCSPSPSAAQDGRCFSAPPAQIVELSEALNSRDDARIGATLDRLAPSGRAPAAEAAARFSPPDRRTHASALTAVVTDSAIVAYLEAAETQSWWRAPPPPAPPDVPYALRVPADMIRGLVAIAEAYPSHRERALGLARSAGDYLLSASDEAGVAYAPFPFWQGREGRLGDLSDRMVERLRACGALEQNVRNGWFVVTEKPEEYFFDTGRVGEALAELYAVTGEARYLAWIENATRWLSAQPLSTNFNYNAFPANFHADAFLATGDARQLEFALDRLRYGVPSWHDPRRP